jgi:hypothetical protein
VATDNQAKSQKVSKLGVGNETVHEFLAIDHLPAAMENDQERDHV